MKKTIYILALISLSTLLKVSAQISPADQTRLQSTLDSVCAAFKLKGASAAVLIPHVGVWKGAYGYSKDGVPVSTDMLMGMGSNTKTHIAAVLLKLQEQGLVDLDDTIGKWIQQVPNIKGSITIRQCLNHTSGLFDYMQNSSINDSILGKPSKIWTMEEILRLAKTPLFAPGSSWAYSNTNYIVAGIIIQTITQQAPFTAMKQILLTPNGLHHTYNFGEQPVSEPIANPWSMVETGTEQTDMTTVPYLNQVFSLANTAGALITTVEDNVYFWHKLIKGNILSATSLKELTQTVYLNSNTSYGLGIFRLKNAINGRTVYSHGGTFFGYINENIIDTTSGITISVLTNQDSIENDDLLYKVIPALHKVLLTIPVGVKETTLADKLQLYPNPANNQLYLKGVSAIKGSKVVLTAVNGTIAINKEADSDLIDISALPGGLYIVQVQLATGEHVYYKKLLVTHE